VSDSDAVRYLFKVRANV